MWTLKDAGCNGICVTAGDLNLSRTPVDIIITGDPSCKAHYMVRSYHYDNYDHWQESRDFFFFHLPPSDIGPCY